MFHNQRKFTTMANKAKIITIDADDVVTMSNQAPVQSIALSDAELAARIERNLKARSANPMHNAITIVPAAPVTKPIEQPEPVGVINQTSFRAAIKKQFTGSRAVIDHIVSLGLTTDSTTEIEKLRVIFFDAWPELSFEKLGHTPGAARKAREDMYEGDRKLWSADVKRIYDATKSAWKWIKEQCDLKAAPKKRQPMAGTGKTGDDKGDDKTIDPAKVTTFEELAQLAVDVAALIDMIATKATQAKIKSAGLVPAMQSAARDLRKQVATSRDGLK